MDDLFIYGGLNRTLCDVLKEMRNCVKTNNFSYLAGLIEEAQSMGNKMEAALADQSSATRAREVIKEAKKELRELKSEMGSLKEIQKLSK